MAQIQSTERQVLAVHVVHITVAARQDTLA